MRSSLILLTFSGALVGFNADAGVVEYSRVDGTRAAAWTDAPCSALESSPKVRAKCVESLAEVSADAIGPSGGVLLARQGNDWFEANFETGYVYRVTTDGRGTILDRQNVTRIKLPPGRRLRALVSGRVNKVDDAAALVDAAAPVARGLFTLTFVVGDSGSYERFEYSFDLETLEPTIDTPTLRAVAPATDPPVLYWNPSFEYWGPSVE